MRTSTLTFVAVTAAAGLAFAPLAGGAVSERLSDPLAYMDSAGGADDVPGPGDLVHSVENLPNWAACTADERPDTPDGVVPCTEVAEGADSAEGFTGEAVARIDVLGLSGTRHPSIPDRDGNPEGGVVRGGAEGDLGTFIEFFSPTVPDPETGQDTQIDVAIMGVNDMGALLIDITDPTSPELLSVLNCGYHQSDVGAYQLEDGRWIVALGGDEVADHENCLSNPISPYYDPRQPAAGSGDEVMAFFDVTDPRQPQALSSVATQETAIGGSHTIEMHPTAPIAYIVTALDPRVEVVDFSDPSAPVITNTVDTPGMPHAFRVSDDGTRAYSAGSLGGQTMSIHDVTDPKNPLPLAVTSAPRNLYTHEVLPAHDKSFALIMDEGAFDPGYSDGVCPGTGFWLYDLTVENAPVPMSYTVADIGEQMGTEPGTGEQTACAVHYGALSADDSLYTVGWYGAGVRVFDLSEPLDPVEVGHMMFSDSNVWTAKAYKDDNHVFVADLTRGFEVYEWTGEGSLASVAADAE